MEHNGQLVGIWFDFVTLIWTVDSYFLCKLKKMNQVYSEQLQGYVKMVIEFCADISFVNNGETWFFGHNILYFHVSAILNQFMYNFSWRIIEKELSYIPSMSTNWATVFFATLEAIKLVNIKNGLSGGEL